MGFGDNPESHRRMAERLRREADSVLQEAHGRADHLRTDAAAHERQAMQLDKNKKEG